MLIWRETYESLLVVNAEKGTRIRHLEAEKLELHRRLAEQKEATQYERERGEIATDELLRHLGSAPVTPPQRMTSETDPFLEDPEEVKGIMQRIEEIGAGQALLEATQ